MKTVPEDNTKRFSSKVDNYVKYRPGYPIEIIDFLQDAYQLSTDKIIADIGSGTGISSQLFLDKNYRVIGIEPNKEMREKSVELLGGYENFSVIDAAAENTGLDVHSIDVIIAGQAFHWFDKTACKKEFERILKPKGLIALIWNERLAKSEFEQEYNELIVKHSIDYVKVDHRKIDEKTVRDFFHPNPVELKVFPNRQIFDFEGFKGRLFSSSYIPDEDDPRSIRMVADLKVLFDKYQSNNTLTFRYATKVYIAR